MGKRVLRGATPGIGTGHAIATRLLSLTLKVYDGNIKDWLPWWQASRTTVHENPAISDVDKFQYLVRFTSK